MWIGDRSLPEHPFTHLLPQLTLECSGLSKVQQVQALDEMYSASHCQRAPHWQLQLQTANSS